MVATAHALPYPIILAPGALDRLGEVVADVGPRHRVIAITDPTVGELYGQRVAAALAGLDSAGVLHFPISEASKTLRTWEDLTDLLLTRQFGRDSTLIALGGGVVGDVVGFVAATYMRGIACVQVPTTLLAMVDASIGGKTGVDTRHGKNLVGAFHPPAAVVIDPRVLATLDSAHLRGGFAEIIKHGVVADADYFRRAVEFLRAGGLTRNDWDAWTPLIQGSVEIKSDVVARDEREAGLRKVLNFGHTIAHAIEAATGYRQAHGEAVAIGMVVEARIALLLGVTDAGTVSEIEQAVRLAGLPHAVEGIDPEALLAFTRSDKKARGGRVEYALPTGIGEMAGADRGYGTPVDDDIVREALRS